MDRIMAAMAFMLTTAFRMAGDKAVVYAFAEAPEGAVDLGSFVPPIGMDLAPQQVLILTITTGSGPTLVTHFVGYSTPNVA